MCHFRCRSVLFTKSAILLIAILTALAVPSLASAQGAAASFDAAKSTSGTNKIQGNYMTPAGGYSLTAFGGAQIQLNSIKVELQYLSGGVWTSFTPKQEQTAGATMPNWSALGWIQMQGGNTYRVYAVMNYQYKLNPADPWTPNSIPNTDFQKTFP
ncbi:MAG: hypothetical protein L0Y72_07615 [Gemmataceae bacterium]|nr:hypothetical protein [Gemmataceae bacterium]MCI0738896.1 hypothetical protein [Gemmataceae bacterium]